MDSRFMTRAIELAHLAASQGEIPVGAVIVKDGQIIGEGYNMREQKNNALSHAETEAINSACKHLGDWRVDGCTIYVTLEPCTMCAGACINARIGSVVCALKDPKAGAMGSVMSATKDAMSPMMSAGGQAAAPAAPGSRSGIR